MKLLSIAFFGAVALFGIGACERHDFSETRKLQDHGDASHQPSSAGAGHGDTGHAPAAHGSAPGAE